MKQTDLNLLPFDQVTKFFFERSNPSWYEDEGELFEMADGNLIRYCTFLFLNSKTSIGSFSPLQRDSGLKALINEMMLPSALWYSNLDIALRAQCLRSIKSLFLEGFFHQENDELCFMWWDMFRWFGPEPPFALKSVISEVLEEILYLDNESCQFSALHGFSHLLPDKEREAVISKFLSIKERSNEVSKMALAAIKGQVL